MSVIKNWRFMAAVLFTLTAVAFNFGPGGIRWMWDGQAPVAVALGLGAAVFWALLAVDTTRGRGRPQHH